MKVIKEDEEDEELASSRCMLTPDSPLRISWNIMLLLFIIYQAIAIPFRLGFNVPVEGGYAIFEDIITAVFLIDILVNFNTGFYRKGNIVLNRKEVAKQYIKFWLWLDLVASFPYDWVMLEFTDTDEEDDQNTSLYKAPQLLRLIKLFRFLRILKLIRICKLKQILIKMEDFITSNTVSTIFLIFKLLSVIIFIAHWTACWFYFISF
ncbi:MAG: ion transporter, partial [Kangiellaceae bacterium]|nr:ion transporter [Kangiellaceae bacterium]